MAFVNNWRTFDSRLIEFVLLKPILYNTRLKDFRNKNMKENAWRKTADELHRWIFYSDTTVGLFIHSLIFSECELTFAISGRPSVCLSSVCNVRAPYSAYWNFWQFFHAIWYNDHLWPFDENFTQTCCDIFALSKIDVYAACISSVDATA